MTPTDHFPARPLRIAVVQNAATPGEVSDNALHAAAKAARAATGGARLAVFPELHLCAYDLPRLVDPHADTPDGVVPADDSRRVSDPRLTVLRKAAAHHRITALIGAAVRHPDGRLTNSLLAVEPTGAVTVAYDKQHLWQESEAALFTPGSRSGFLTIDGWRLGLGICYDMSFPEHARTAAVFGAHAYVCPSAFARGTEHRAGIHLRARALENTVYSVFANPLEGPDERPCNGTSAVHGPDGTTVCRAEADRETVLIADLDPAALTHARRHLRMLEEYRRSPAAGSPPWSHGPTPSPHAP